MYSVRLIVWPSSAAANTMTSPEAAALIAPRNVMHCVPVQSLVVSSARSLALVTVSMVASPGAAIADSNSAKTDSVISGLDDRRMELLWVRST